MLRPCKAAMQGAGEENGTGGEKRAVFRGVVKYANIVKESMRPAFPGAMAALWLAALMIFAAPASSAQEPEAMDASLPVFEFHSSFWVNLHHFLYHEARARMAVKEAGESGATKTDWPTLRQSNVVTSPLTAEQQRVWDDAIAYYIANYAGKDLLVNIDLILLKDQLGDFEACPELTGKKQPRCDAGLPGRIGPVLESVASIYRAHWWADQDRTNRRWVARVAPLVREQGVGLSERLAEIYQTRWPKERIRVDVCAYANAAGAYTTIDPLRVTIASTDPRNQGAEAFEVLFHEASHSIALPVQAAINRECKQRDKPIPRNLWHALIFYTTGEVLRPIMKGQPEPAKGSAEKGGDAQKPASQTAPPAPPKPNLVPYELRDILTQRGWEEYHLLLVLYWQPYLDGKVSFEDAIAHLISAA